MDDDEYRRHEKRSSYPCLLHVPEGSRGLKSNASTRLITLIGIILLTGSQLVKCRLSDTGMNTMEVGDRQGFQMPRVLIYPVIARNPFMNFVRKKYATTTNCKRDIFKLNFDTIRAINVAANTDVRLKLPLVRKLEDRGCNADCEC